MNQASRTFLRLAVIFLVGLSTSGCDQVRDKVSQLIAPQPSSEVLKNVNSLIEASKFKEAFDKASVRAEGKDPELRGEFAIAAARAAAYLGDLDGSIKYLTIAFKTHGLSPQEVMIDTAFENIRTNVRFVQFLVAQDVSSDSESTKQNASADQVNQGISVNAGGDTSIKMNSKGTEVRAGDVVIRMPN